VREHTAAIQPPRALWVPFILGRPFGVPGDPAFQRRVLMAALRLLESPQPVLADYPEEAPAAAPDELGGIACPVSFDRTADAADWGALLEREIEELASWHDLAVSRRSRTTTGFSGITIAEAARIVVSSLRAAPVPNLAGMDCRRDPQGGLRRDSRLLLRGRRRATGSPRC
jgi:hypothetical protein